MNGDPTLTRGLQTPVASITTEIAIYPFASRASFETPLSILDPGLSGATRQLWLAAEVELSRSNPGLRLDELTRHRDTEWFSSGSEPVALHQVWKNLVARTLVARGRVAVPQSLVTPLNGTPEPAFQVRLRYRWLSRLLPADFLLAPLWEQGQEPIGVELLDPQLFQRLVDGGFGETHLHLGAGINFPAYWAATMVTLASSRVSLREMDSLGSPLAHDRQRGFWLAATGIGRWVLARFLHAVEVSPRWRGKFGPWLESVGLPEFQTQFGSGFALQTRQILVALATGQSGPLSPTATVAMAGLNQLTRQHRAALPRTAKLFEQDPVSQWLPQNPQRPVSPELRLLVTARRYLESQSADWQTDQKFDADFARLFWQVERVRHLYYQWIVYSGRTPGLESFSRSYSRLSPGRRVLSEADLAEHAAETCGLGRGLKFLELRTSPAHRADQLSQMLSSIDRRLGNVQKTRTPRIGMERLEWGLILHFVRTRRHPRDLSPLQAHETNTFANPAYGPNVEGYRYSGCVREIERNTWAIIRLLRRDPRALRQLRGIDLCTDERAIPTWVHAPYFRAIRKVSTQASAALRAQTGECVEQLRCTIHIGEDFPHLLTGLRNIGQLLDYFPLESGDRLGHAIALGVRSQHWAAATGRLPMAAEDRMWDLAWAWDFLSRAATNVSASQVLAIEKELRELFRQLFGEPLEPASIVELNRRVHGLQARFARRRPSPSGADPQAVRLLEWLTSPRVFRRGQETVWVDASAELEVCSAAQSWLRQRVSALGLAVEMNPSSNLLIASLHDLSEHPFWRLTGVADPGDSVPVTVGSDDPISFATSLPDEYGLLYDMLLSAGRPGSTALEICEFIRRTSCDFRFTVG